MESWQIYEGFYALQDMTIQVKIFDGNLTSAFPGFATGV